MFNKIIDIYKNYRIKKIYNHLYKYGYKKNNETFDYNDYDSSSKKFRYVLRYAKEHSFVLDVGCGKGHYLKELLYNDISIFGVELSKYCCKTYLYGLPHVCEDITKFRDNDNNIYPWSGLICMDVLEHIPYNKLDNFLQNIYILSPTAFFGIANHEEKLIKNIDLHCIKQNIIWWNEVLKKYYSYVALIIPPSDDKWMCKLYEQQRFFFFHCKK